MKNYRITYWAEYNDEPTDFYVDIKAENENEAITKAKTSSFTARLGKYFEIIKIKK